MAAAKKLPARKRKRPAKAHPTAQRAKSSRRLRAGRTGAAKPGGKATPRRKTKTAKKAPRSARTSKRKAAKGSKTAARRRTAGRKPAPRPAKQARKTARPQRPAARSAKAAVQPAASAMPAAAATPAVGTFCWVELATSDAGAARSFYARLFGWNMDDSPLPDGGVYTMCALNGAHVGAIWPMHAEMRSQGVPPHWGVYVRVADAGAAAEKIRALGGHVLQGPFDVMDAGRMAVVLDPTGATVLLWQANRHPGFGVTDGRPGSVGWVELMTTDATKAGDFYGGAFGWTREAMPIHDDETYTVFKRGAMQVAGMMQLTPAMTAQGIPSNWLTYFSVADCDGAAARAQALGATVMVAPQDVPGVGRFAVIRDPQGATFAVIKFARR